MLAVSLQVQSETSDAWFTPKFYVELVRSALGGSIDFDPFSNDIAQKTVKAREFYIETDALVTPWPECNNVFMKPPYSRGLTARAIDAFIENFDDGKFKRGILLVNNATDTRWWKRLAWHEGLSAFCFTRGRIAFENADGKAISGNTRGQAFILFQAGKLREQLDACEQFNHHFDKPEFVRIHYGNDEIADYFRQDDIDE